MRSYWFRVGPDQMTGVLIRGGKLGHRHRHKRMSCDYGSRSWNDSSINQGMPVVQTEFYVIYYKTYTFLRTRLPPGWMNVIIIYKYMKSI